MSAGVFNQIDPDSEDEQPLINPGFSAFNFDVIDGIEYRIDVTRPARYDADGYLINADSYRIVEILYNGAPLAADQRFIVATNSYRAGGGGNFPGLDGSNIVIEAPDSNRDVLANYIFEQQLLQPSADGNWSFVPIPGRVNVTFRSAPDADSLLPPRSMIEKVGTGDGGFGEYRLDIGQ